LEAPKLTYGIYVSPAFQRIGDTGAVSR